VRDDASPNSVKGQSGSDSNIAEFPASEFQAAVALETRERDFVFACDPRGRPFTIDILGVPIVVMTLAHALNLIQIGAPFLCGGFPTIEHVFRFLWYLHRDFDANLSDEKYPAWKAFLWKWASSVKIIERRVRPNSRQLLLLQISVVPLVAWWRVIREHIAFVFAEAPGAGREKDESGNEEPLAEEPKPIGAPLTSFACDYVDQFGAEYGWSAKETMLTPLPQLFALMRSIEIRHYARYGKRAPLINYRSDRIKSEHMQRRNTTELKEARAKKFAHLFAQAPAAETG
jgi:hypothetical protein